VVKDNGTMSSKKDDEGIGLKNIADRIVALNGHVNITSEHGFRIFISVPKND